MAVPKPKIMGAETLLADGTSLSQLIDLDRREVSLRVLNDPEIYQWELERLWSQAWIIVGHDSEIPKPGDFIRSDIAEDSVIVVRRADKSIEVLLNVCPHKGMQVCRAEAGNTPAFRCVYHGWTYGLDGTFRGAPFEKQMYGEMDKSRMNLRRARVGTFAGLIFANWSDAAPSLDEYLGDFAWYMRAVFDRTSQGIEVLGAPQRFSVPANWKTASEQFAGDGYHSITLHRSLVDLGFMRGKETDPKTWGLLNPRVCTDQGHNIICLDMRDIWGGMAAVHGSTLTTVEKLTKMPPPGVPSEMVQDMAARFSDGELRVLADTPPSVGGIFPNIAIISFYVPLPDGTVCGTYGIHQFTPRGPNAFEFTHWNFVARGASQEFRERVQLASNLAVGASGFVEQDDAEVFPAQQRSARGFIGRQSKMRYLALDGPNRPVGWVGGGTVFSGFAKDDTQWNWWRRYYAYMARAS